VKFSQSLLAIALSISGAAALAHTHLQKSTPADGSVIASEPSNIVLQFSEATRLTALTLQKEKESQQKLGPLPSTPSAQVSVAMPALTPGGYVVSWRGIGKDNHVRSGTIRFTVSDKAAQASKATPDSSAHH
jgi:methionine-rich copper-binding protein CopC